MYNETLKIFHSALHIAASLISEAGHPATTVSQVKAYPCPKSNLAMSKINQKTVPPAQIYIAISAALLAPVILWPALLSAADNGLNPGQNIHFIWLIMASALLICAATADSMINYRPDSLWPVFTCTWILLATLGISIALRLPAGAWLLALMFAIHSLRAMVALWRNQQHWHLWPAWARDTLASAAIFIWTMA